MSVSVHQYTVYVDVCTQKSENATGKLPPGQAILRGYILGIFLSVQSASYTWLGWSDEKWSVTVVVKLYRLVCITSIHIFTFMNVYVLCTYIYINSWTCMYMLHTIIHVYIWIYVCTMYIHVHEWMNWYEHVHTCLYHVQTRTYSFAVSCPGW